MSELATFMAAPAAACIILAVVFSYFGVHVLKREIVFVDLSLAQLAALGTTVAYVMEIELDTGGSQALSLAFVAAGAIFFAYIRFLQSKVPHEAIIGIVYVVGASLAILIVNRAPHGAEHLKNLLDGSILWINWKGLLQLTVVVAMVSLVHWRFRERFFKLSREYKNSKGPGNSQTLWDFVFYLSLGLVIVSSVRTAGVFLIFTLLIVPAVCGALFFDTMTRQFAAGAVLSVLVSVSGLVVSYLFDQPTGAVVVSCFGLAFLAALIARRFMAFGNR
ncbi:MAG: metal ABC transporter permease [Nitrospinae bacterium]|nr:metal ABC transporter permease [Nitrospinota bacterium]